MSEIYEQNSGRWHRELMISFVLALSISSKSYADTYVTTEGDTIVITNQPSSKQRRQAKVINRAKKSQSHLGAQTCYLENRKTKEKVLTTSPTLAQLKASRVIWCEERSAPSDSTRTSIKNEGRTKRTPSRAAVKNSHGGRSLPKRADRFKGFVTSAAQKFDLPEALLWAFMKVESDFIPTAVSRKGAQGLMQLMPLTAKDMGVTDPFDPQQNIFGAAKLIGILMKRFNREIPLVISAYHAGGGAVTRREGIPYSETSQYMTSVLNAYYRYMKKPPYVRDQ